ncbi:MAG: hypothetical protein AAFN09_08295 [Pseudomonadota bacterium]
MGLGKSLRDRLSGLALPALGKEAEIAVFLVHNSRDPEDYFFLFDFEEFADRSRAGIFVRPALRVYAGRDDFSRVTFARQFRAVFQREFDRMRTELAEGKGKRGWLDFKLGVSAVDLIGGLVANLVLAIATSAGKVVLTRILGLPNLLKAKSDEAKLADEIDKTKRQVESALERIEVTLHRELYDHAYRGGPAGKVSGLDRDAWPLPDYVRAHLSDGESGSWW